MPVALSRNAQTIIRSLTEVKPAVCCLAPVCCIDFASQAVSISHESLFLESKAVTQIIRSLQILRSVDTITAVMLT